MLRIVARLAAAVGVVTINPPPPPALASIILSPASASLALAGSTQFRVKRHNSAGDSAAVAVTFSATGGSITSAGLYTAGATAGSYKVIASSKSLADTAVVTLTQVLSSSVGGTRVGGVPFGPWGGLSGPTSWKGGMEPFTATMGSTTPANIVSQIATARAAKRHLVINMTGGSHNRYLTNGVFDVAKWSAVIDGYDSPGIKRAIAEAVADGTLVGNSVMDEPNVHGLGDGNTWGPSGTMTKARVDQMCSYVKNIFPTLQVGVVHRHDVFEPDQSYHVCEFIVDQYSTRAGDVAAFRDAALAMGRRDGHAILFAMNILNGGVQDKDGIYDCSLSGQGGVGTYSPNCRMTPQQVRDYGLVLGPAGCGLLMWRYDAAFFANPENQQAFRDVAARLATLPARPCKRS